MIQRSIVLLVMAAVMGIFTILTGPVLASEGDYPTKPVTIHVGMPPGGMTSVSLHIVVEGLPRYLAKPQPFIINHKPGASGLVAADYVVKLPTDGYNLLSISIDAPLRMALEPEKISFKKEDFSYINTFAHAPYTLSVNNQSPFKTLEEFIEYAKKHPQEMTYSTSGIASGGHFVGEIFTNATGIKLTHVPFQGGNPALLAALGGHVSCTISTVGQMGTHIKPGGNARALTVFDDKRYPGSPDLPTAKEKGYDVVGGSYFFLAAKKGTPKPVLDILVNLFKQAGNDPKVVAALTNTGLIASRLGPEETERKVFRDYDLGRDIFGKLGLLEK